MKQHHFFIALMLLLASCTFLTPEFTPEDLKLIQWAEKGKYITFVSNQHETVKYLITDIVYQKSGAGGAGIQPSHYTISQSVRYSNGAMFVIHKNGNGAPQMDIYFEGVDVWAFSGITTGGYNYFCTDTVINQLSYNDVMVVDNPKGKTQITKLIWSKHHGLLEYHTKDGKVWIRQNVNPNAIYPEVYTPPLSWSERVINFLGKNMLLILVVLFIIMIIKLTRKKR